MSRRPSSASTRAERQPPRARGQQHDLGAGALERAHATRLGAARPDDQRRWRPGRRAQHLRARRNRQAPVEHHAPRAGARPRARARRRRTVRRGSSARTVPAPTRIASCAARSSCAARARLGAGDPDWRARRRAPTGGDEPVQRRRRLQRHQRPPLAHPDEEGAVGRPALRLQAADVDADAGPPQPRDAAPVDDAGSDRGSRRPRARAAPR